MAVNPNTAFTTGQVLTADAANRWPRGVMGYVFRSTGNISLTTTVADITGASITFTAEANRVYLVTFCATTNKPSAGYVDVTFTDASNTTIANTIQSVSNSFAIINFSFLQTTLSAGSKTIKVRAGVDSGTGTIYGSVGNPYSFVIQDMGPA